MPLYEFYCQSCGAEFEELASPEAPCPACPACGAKSTQRKISLPGPLKTGAFPFPPTGQIHPLASKMASGPACGGQCGKR
ncbi:MAG: zinc ribbon domain-containing protein [Desulfovibrio sp.]|nr:zinc ribbon domain-containing protein [Desulfovibrio sp.]